MSKHQFEIPIRMQRAYKDAQQRMHVVGVISDDQPDYYDDRMSEKCLKGMVRQADGLKLLDHHEGTFEFGVGVDGEIRRNGEAIELEVDFVLDATYPQSTSLYRKVEAGGDDVPQLSIGGFIDLDVADAVDWEEIEGRTVRVINALTLEHVATTRKGFAANDRTRFVAAIMKSLPKAEPPAKPIEPTGIRKALNDVLHRLQRVQKGLGESGDGEGGAGDTEQGDGDPAAGDGEGEGGDPAAGNGVGGQGSDGATEPETGSEGDGDTEDGAGEQPGVSDGETSSEPAEPNVAEAVKSLCAVTSTEGLEQADRDQLAKARDHLASILDPSAVERSLAELREQVEAVAKSVDPAITAGFTALAEGLERCLESIELGEGVQKSLEQITSRLERIERVAGTSKSIPDGASAGGEEPTKKGVDFTPLLAGSLASAGISIPSSE